MPYVEVTLNDSAAVCAGAENISVLTAAVIVGPDGNAQVQVTGLRQTQAHGDEFLFWTSSDLTRGGSVQFKVLRHASTIANLAIIEPSDQVVDEDRRPGERDLRMHPSAGHANARAVQASQPITLVISIDQTDFVDAAIGQEEILQAEVTFTRRGWTLRADALTILETGHTKGPCWTTRELKEGQVVEIVYKQ
jgi:hypothetical protein